VTGLTINSINNGKFNEKELAQMRAIITREVTEKVTELVESKMMGEFQAFWKKRNVKDKRKIQKRQKSTPKPLK
jgi:hypothetical protein